MRKKTVKNGLIYIIIAMVIITTVTFFHDEIAWLLLLSPTGETELTVTGLVIGGLCGGLGVLITALGFLQTSIVERDIYLKPIIVTLAAVILLFMVLLYVSFKIPSQPKILPGETITI